MSEAPPEPPRNLDSTEEARDGVGAPKGATEPTEVARAATPKSLFAWLGVIAILGGVWWWFGRSEPDAPLATDAKTGVLLKTGERPARTNAVPASSEWVTALEHREMTDIAERRTEAARRLVARQGLGARGQQRPNWDRAGIAAKAGSRRDAAAP